jgi:pimeloyl-ACP methyl ester carboxylesterase
MASSDVIARPIRIPIEREVCGYVVRGWLYRPQAAVRNRPVGLYCLAGGGLTTGYYDIVAEGYPGYSMAEYMAERGVLVVAVDHPGIGASAPVRDLYEVTPTRVSQLHHEVASQLRDELRLGSLVPGFGVLDDLSWVGLGHSMGGMLVDVVQGRHETFDAIVGLGHGGEGLPEVLTEEERLLTDRPLAEVEADIVHLARRRFETLRRGRSAAPDFFDEAVPEGVRNAFARARDELLYTCGLASIIPGSTDVEKGCIQVPLFLALGDSDLITDLVGCARRYPSVSDITLFRLAGSGHNHNTSPNRHVLWTRILRWLDSLPDPLGAEDG